MKLLDQFYDSSKAEDLAWRLRKKGILTYISSKRSHRLSSYRTGALRVGLWVVLDKQFKDAKKYLKNHHHVPEFRLTEEEMVTYEKEAEAYLSRTTSRLLTKLANWFMALLLLAIVAFISYKAIYVL